MVVVCVCVADQETLEAIFARLLSVIQNTAVEPCFRLRAVRWVGLSVRVGTAPPPHTHTDASVCACVCVCAMCVCRWLISLACYSPMDSILFQYTSELCPKWHDPLGTPHTHTAPTLHTHRGPCSLSLSLSVCVCVCVCVQT